MMGWCPDSNAFATKRMMVTLPSDEVYGMKDQNINFSFHFTRQV
ncbi:MAG: hypothetical protein FIB07_11295 [Candidatus Methanoperedens sp.]|nr:hypothetical protein [Candidatus Methanoperedens sp.]